MLPVTSQAGPHRVPDGKHGNGSAANFAVARRAINPGSIVRRVPKANKRRRTELVDALPWNLNASCGVRSHLFDFRLVGSESFMAQHALPHRGDAGFGPLVRGRVAVETRQAERHVPVVGKLDGLVSKCRHGADAQGKQIGMDAHVVQES